MSTLSVINLQSQSTTSPVVFQTSTGTEIGQLCRAWVNFNGTTSPGTIRASFNVSSVTKNGGGDYTVNFTTSLADANYAVTLGMSPQNGRWLCNYSGTFNNITTPVTNSTGSVRVYVADINNATQDATNAYVAIFR